VNVGSAGTMLTLIRADAWQLYEFRAPFAVPGSMTPSALGLAVAAFTGVTWGAAHVVSRMLMPDVVGGRTRARNRRG
jgi:hypothetical protein